MSAMLWGSLYCLCLGLSVFVCSLPSQADDANARETKRQKYLSTAKTSIVLPAQNANQIAILNGWKTSVRKFPRGIELIDMLNSANERISHNSTEKISHYMRGYLYGILGCTGWAIDDLSMAIAQDPQFALAYKERGICYMDLGKYQEAMKDLNEALKIDPRSGDALLARGRLYLILNQPQRALPDLYQCAEEPVSFIPALPGELPGNYFNAPQYYLSWCYRYLGKQTLAQAHLDKSSIPEDRAAVRSTEYLHRWADKPSIR